MRVSQIFMPLREKIFELLYEIAIDNIFTCNRMSDITEDLLELLSDEFGGSIIIANLLTEIFRLIEPNLHNYEDFFENWCGRLATINNDNVSE